MLGSGTSGTMAPSTATSGTGSGSEGASSAAGEPWRLPRPRRRVALVHDRMLDHCHSSAKRIRTLRSHGHGWRTKCSHLGRTADAGNFSFGRGHPMQPHRERLAYTLMLNYGLVHKVDAVVRFSAAPRRRGGAAASRCRLAGYTGWF